MPYPYDADDLAAIDRMANDYNGNDYDVSTNPYGFADGGHRVNFEPALQDVATAAAAMALAAEDAADSADTATTQASNASTSASTATTQAGIATTQASNAAASAATLLATSTTSFTPSVGSQALTTQSGKSLSTGTIINIASSANPTTNYGHGTVTAYSGTSLTVTFDKVGASPLSASDWNISLSGPVGAAGSNGSTGSTGAIGSAGGAITIPYTFSTTTTDSDPGNGVIRLNNATQSSATAARLDLLDSNGATWTTDIDAFDASTNTNKGQFRIFAAADPTKFLAGNITAVDSSTGYRNVTIAVTSSSASSPFSNSDALMFCFTRTGDKGADGAGSGDVVGPASATDNALARYDTTTGKLLQNSTVSLGDSGPLAPLTTDTVALGSTTLMWSDLFLASGGVVNWNNGDVTITHSSNQLAFAGASTSYSFDAAVVPATNDAAALGTSSLGWSDIFLATGAVLNFANSNYTITHSSGALTLSGTLSIGTSNAFTAGTIELGAASDTTLSRSAAGVLAVEGVVIPSISSTSTLTNKRVTPRRGSTTSSATPTINTDNVDIYSLTALAADITSFTSNLSGTPVHGDGLLIEITGTATRAITWGASFEASTIALPTTTASTAMLSVAFIWNSTTSKWRCVGVA